MKNTVSEIKVCKISVPDDLWPDIDDRVPKVVLKCEGANTLPPDVFIQALRDNGIVQPDDVNKVRVNIPHSKRKRVVYGLEI